MHMSTAVWGSGLSVETSAKTVKTCVPGHPGRALPEMWQRVAATHETQSNAKLKSPKKKEQGMCLFAVKTNKRKEANGIKRSVCLFNVTRAPASAWCALGVVSLAIS